MKRITLWVVATLLLMAQGAWAQGVLTTDAMIRMAEQKAKLERKAQNGKRMAPAQQEALTLVVKVADENAADTYARLREQGVTIRGRIGQQAIVQVPLDKVETIAQMDGILRVDVGHQGHLTTDVSREVTGVNLVNGSDPTVSSPFTGKGVTVCVMDMGLDFKHPAFKDAQGRSRIKCVYSMLSDKGRKFVVNDPVAGPIEYPGSVFDTPELISTLAYDTKVSPHGGHTTSTAAGSRSPQGFCGMAPEADIVYLAMSPIITDDDVNADTVSIEGSALSDPNPNESEQTDQIVEQYLAFANAYAQQSDQPVVLSASLGSHLGPHDGTGTVPEAISAVSKNVIPVFASGNEGGKSYHVYYQFADDKPSFSVGLSASLGEPIEGDDPDNPFIWAFTDKVRGYTRAGQSGEISLQLNLVGHDNALKIKDYVWSSPVITSTVDSPDQAVIINADDYPEVKKYFKGKVYLGIRTLADGQRELTVMPKALCKELRGVASYGLTITVTSTPGTAVDLWQNSFRFLPYEGNGYIIGDDFITGSDWSSTPDVISVGAWCANTTSRAYRQGAEDIESTDKTLGDIASFSSYGPMFNGVIQPTVCAPGDNVVAAWNKYCDPFLYSTTVTYIDAMTWQGYPYGPLSGTSMACPTAAGIIALWLQANPTLTLADVKDVLAHSCDNDEFTAKNPVRWGYGKINAKKGLDYIQQATGISATLNDKVTLDPRSLATNGTQEMINDVWYTLDGRRMGAKPTQRGLYIKTTGEGRLQGKNGMKFVVR